MLTGQRVAEPRRNWPCFCKDGQKRKEMREGVREEGQGGDGEKEKCSSFRIQNSSCSKCVMFDLKSCCWTGTSILNPRGHYLSQTFTWVYWVQKFPCEQKLLWKPRQVQRFVSMSTWERTKGAHVGSYRPIKRGSETFKETFKARIPTWWKALWQYSGTL